MKRTTDAARRWSHNWQSRWSHHPGKIRSNRSHAHGKRQVLACQETETEDSFSMNCAPTVIPDTSDNLTEAEVAQPGWNSGPGGEHGHGSQ